MPSQSTMKKPMSSSASKLGISAGDGLTRPTRHSFGEPHDGGRLTKEIAEADFRTLRGRQRELGGTIADG
jgi:hypothetical protein